MGGGGEIDLLQKIWCWTESILTTKDMKYNLLIATGNKGNTDWHMAEF
jgi:hypothetical protein